MAVDLGEAVYMGDIKAVEVDPFDAGLRAMWMFKGKNSRGEETVFACVLEEDVMLEMIACMDEVTKFRQKSVSIVRSAPAKLMRLVEQSKR